MAQFFDKVNWIDLLVVILLIRSSYVGFTKGFGWEFFRFIGYLCAGLVTIYYYEEASRLIGDYLPVLYPFSNFLSFTAIYVAILFIFKFINLLIEKIIKIETFSTVEKLGGLFLGLLRGGILTSLLLISLMLTPIPYFEKSIKERSYTGQVAVKIAPFLFEKAGLLFPALKFGLKNEALSKMTDLKEGLFMYHGVPNASETKKAVLKGDRIEN